MVGWTIEGERYNSEPAEQVDSDLLKLGCPSVASLSCGNIEESSMPWQAPSGTTYRLCLLDTNALSEIVKRPTVEGRGFLERLPPSGYMPCFTVYNIFEIRRVKAVYKLFLNFFSVYPSFLLAPYPNFLEAERQSTTQPLSIKSYVIYSFSPIPRPGEPAFREAVDLLFANPDVAREEQDWRQNEQSILADWLKNAQNFKPRRTATTAIDADRYVSDAAIDTLGSIAPAWLLSQTQNNSVPNLSRLPAFQTMLYSQYYRIFDPHWQPSPQEVTDVRIMACAPYVDTVVTERFQAAIFAKIRSRVQALQSLEILTLRDLRPKS